MLLLSAHCLRITGFDNIQYSYAIVKLRSVHIINMSIEVYLNICLLSELEVDID